VEGIPLWEAWANVSKSDESQDLTILGLRLDRRLSVALIVGTTVLMLDFYNRFLPASTPAAVLRAKAIERVGYYLVIPMLLILLQKDRPRDYGWRLGSVRAGLIWVGGSLAVALPFLVVVARTPSMVSYYASVQRTPWEVMLISAADLIGWEFFFRGYLIFTLARLVGPNAILLQAVPFALAHLGKPQVETLTTLLGGAYFGWLSWRTRSFLYAFALHWMVNVIVIALAMTAHGA
jgi:membrane protease YdiL (CAAX protease family)